MLFTIIAPALQAQEEPKFSNKEKIKKENELLGVKSGSDWLIPPRYNVIEGYDNYIFCRRGDVTDIYRNSYGLGKFIENVRSEHVAFYKAYLPNLKNTSAYCTPYFENGKWGFYGKDGNTGAKFDSLFFLCIQNSVDNNGNRNCGFVLGVFVNGKRGVADTEGKTVVKPGDYTDIQFVYNDKKQGDFSDRFEIICTHKSGTKATFIWLKDNKFVRTEAATKLKGYVYEGDWVEPRYTSIEYIGAPLADYKCLLSDGTAEYRKGAELVDTRKMEAYEAQKAADEKKAQAEKALAKAQADFAAAAGLTVQLKTKTHSLYVYPGWSGIFKDAGQQSDLRSEYGGKKPAEVFKEAPEGWLKNQYSASSLRLLFTEQEGVTTEDAKKDFIAQAMHRSGLTRDKIKLTEEPVVLADGRKGLLLFYVCPDAHGMIGGNYFDCAVYVPSPQNAANLLHYLIFIEGVPDLAAKDVTAWKDYFKKVLLTVRPL